MRWHDTVSQFPARPFAPARTSPGDCPYPQHRAPQATGIDDCTQACTYHFVRTHSFHSRTPLTFRMCTMYFVETATRRAAHKCVEVAGMAGGPLGWKAPNCKAGLGHGKRKLSLWRVICAAHGNINGWRVTSPIQPPNVLP